MGLLAADKMNPLLFNTALMNPTTHSTTGCKKVVKEKSLWPVTCLLNKIQRVWASLSRINRRWGAHATWARSRARKVISAALHATRMSLIIIVAQSVWTATATPSILTQRCLQRAFWPVSSKDHQRHRSDPISTKDFSLHSQLFKRGNSFHSVMLFLCQIWQLIW